MGSGGGGRASVHTAQMAMVGRMTGRIELFHAPVPEPRGLHVCLGFTSPYTDRHGGLVTRGRVGKPYDAHVVISRRFEDQHLDVLSMTPYA